MTEVTPTEIDVAPEADEAAEDPLRPYAALIEAIQKPIAPDTPCGQDVTYDDEFQALRTQINSIGSLGDVNYERIVEIGQSILEAKSKDLTTAGFLSLGLVRTKGVVGMAEALVIIGALIETYWEPMYPQKPKIRRNALQFMADRLKEWLDLRLERQKPTEEEHAPLTVTLERLTWVQDFTMTALADMAPALSGLIASLNEAIRRLPKPIGAEKPPKADPPTTSPKTPSTTAQGEGHERPGSTASDQGEAPETLKSAKEARQVFFKTAAFLRQQDTKNPTPYRVLRVLRWEPLTKEPANDNGKTAIAPPHEKRLAYFTGLLQKGDCEKLLLEAENDFQGTSIYLWLGLQRLMASAMEALGAVYQPAAEAVMIETALLLQRLPGLVHLTFSDGTPFADPMTQEWLDMKVSGLLGTGEAVAGVTVGGNTDHLDAQFQQARQKLGTGDLAGALAVMKDGNGHDASQEDHFRRRFFLAVLCGRGNQPDLARALLESLDEEVTHYRLDAWNPALTLEVWKNLYACYNTLAKTAKETNKASFTERAAQVFDKISRLDAGYALTLIGQTQRVFP